MNDNFFHADGETQNLYYKEILDYLDQGNLKLNYIMENNEAWPAYNLEDKGPTTPNGKPDLFDKCQPALSLCSSCSTVADWKNAISNKRQNVDITSYSSHLLDDSRLKQTNYLNYKIDGDKSNDLYQYTREMQKHSPSAIGDVFTNPIPTPDLYVRKPQNWWVHDRGGLWHSWRYVSDARISELTFNDNLFAPFVAAGWALDEEDNVRSAQWLALLKAQLMLGAYFFHAYHDGITEYPGGPYPYPRGYVWQVTTPAYAQAIGSRMEHILRYGKALSGDVPSNLKNPSGDKCFMFKSTTPNHLITIRQDYSEDGTTALDRWAISGSKQTNTNHYDLTALPSEFDVASIDVPGFSNKLQFDVRRQGSTYILDKTDPGNLAFWQIDKWHQYEFPEYWSKDFSFEAEVMDNKEANCTRTPLPGVTIKTEGAYISTDDFSDFTSYTSFTAPQPLEYRFKPHGNGTTTDYSFYVRARNNTSGHITAMSITLTDLNDGSNVDKWKINCVESVNWEWYANNECSSIPDPSIIFNDLVDDHEYLITIVPMTTDLEIDQIYLAATGSTFSVGVVSTCSSNTKYISGTKYVSTEFGGTGTSNYRIFIDANSTLVIDNDFTFENCIITNADASAIHVSSGYTLTLENCGISTCDPDHMWAGISGSNVIVNHSIIQDAWKAIELDNGMTADIQNSIFDRNEKSILAYAPNSVTINNSVFTCVGELKSPSWYVDIYDPIHVECGSATITNSTFKNVTHRGVVSSPTGDIDVEDCVFDGTDNAITVSIVKTQSISIKNNKFKAALDEDYNMLTEYGISLWSIGTNYADVDIEQNQLTDFARPIYIASLSNSSASISKIYDNTVSLSRSPSELSENGFDYRGIKLVNCIGIDITNNVITWTKFPDDGNDYSDLVQGIRLDNTQDGEVQENLIEKTGTGICMQYHCEDINLKCNTMNKNWLGVFFDDAGSASNYITHQGDWDGTSGGSESWNNRWDNILNASGYKIFGSLSNSSLVPWTYNSGNPSFELGTLPTILSFYLDPESCANTSDCNTPKPTANRNFNDSLTSHERDSIYGQLVGDSSSFINKEQEFQYYEALQFYSDVCNDSSILHLNVVSDSIYIAFYDSLTQHNLGKLEWARRFMDTGDYSTSEDLLNSINNPNQIESNMQFALRNNLAYYLDPDSLLPSIPDSTTVTAMNEIAEESPYYGGQGVYLTRSQLHRDVEIHGNSNKYNNNLKDHKEAVKKVNIQGKVYPNPASESIIYQLKQSEITGNNVIFILRNILGIMEIQIPVKNEISVINMLGLAPGIHFYQVVCNGEIKESGKLIINY